jgi:hypothetical protein
MKKIPIFLGLMLMGCQTVVDIEVPVEHPKITLNSIFTADSLWQVKLSLSQFILANTTIKPLENAEVVVFHNGVAYDTLTEDPPGRYYHKDPWEKDSVLIGAGVYRSQANKKPIPGETYEIVAKAVGFETVSASSAAPVPSGLTSISLEHVGYTAGDRDYSFIIDVSFKDDANTEDFYEFKMFSEFVWIDHETGDTTARPKFEIYLFTDNPFANAGLENRLIFDDRKFNGQEIRLTIKGADYSSGAKHHFVHFRKVNRELFNYILTTTLQEETSGDPLAQPVNVYSNIRNGYGIFAGYSENIYEFKE